MRLTPHLVEKPWGRTSLPPSFESPCGKRIGEIWFETPTGEDLPLLTKYIFTSEKLSIQVHPSDSDARKRGLVRGKSECWYILDADPGATLGLGLTQSVPADELHRAALDGSIEQLVNWRPVAAGEFYFVPPGTIHAIGSGIALVEFQQNADVTYRLYDYGRPRELHLDDGIAVADPGPYHRACARAADAAGDAILLDGPQFSVLRAASEAAIASKVRNRRRWVMPLDGAVTSGGDSATPGECLLIAAGAALEFEAQTVVLIGVEGQI